MSIGPIPTDYQQAVQFDPATEGGGQSDLLGGFWGGEEPPTPIAPIYGGVGPINRPAPGYHAGDEVKVLRGMTAEDRVRLQQQLVALGLATGVLYGEIDDATIGGLTTIMKIANRSGEPWTATLGRIATNPQVAEQAAPPFAHVREPFLPRDPATVDEEIRKLAKDIFGESDIELSDEEVGWLRSKFTELSQMQHQQTEDIAEQQARAVHEAQIAEGGGVITAPTPEGTAIDAGARFRELFNERYAPQIEGLEAHEEMGAQREATGGAMARLLQFATRRV